ncbi:hypothetical protein GCG54_00006147 [Colletotrichum gloeosporioides]|uniref:Uncharacterized protein n=1 Tax=Colletotrichum gloeosporioides TaxID=474922 RepID=A0A8H4CLX8_COLGL|nr:uncharacterized protein GCG54_00006147 [Colletotrichum gloeosporioides]KAF3806385.1 hypothetical protein GCG54_00006147 [Colletotrichum gloeosporioides]
MSSIQDASAGPERPRPPPNRRRDKPTLVCETCRKRKNVTDSNLARGASSMAFSALMPIVALSLPGFPSMLQVPDHGQIFKLDWPSLRAWL